MNLEEKLIITTGIKTISIMNKTKWEKLRISMNQLEYPVKWKSKDIETGHEYGWDSDWYYHFRLMNNMITMDTYKYYYWVEILFQNHREEILFILRKHHLAGIILDKSVKVYGYTCGEDINYF